MPHRQLQPRTHAHRSFALAFGTLFVVLAGLGCTERGSGEQHTTRPHVAAAPAEPTPTVQTPAEPQAPRPTPQPATSTAAAPSEVAELRAAVRSARVAHRRACRARPTTITCERQHADMVTALGALAAGLGCPLAPHRRDAFEDLEGLVLALEEARDAVDPHLFRACLREGGDEADCELLDGQQHEAVGQAETALEHAYSVASAHTLANECGPDDPDLALDPQ